MDPSETIQNGFQNLPVSWQFISTIGMALILAVYGAFRYIRSLSDSAPQSQSSLDTQWKMIGAAFGDAQTLARIAEELRELRHSRERSDDALQRSVEDLVSAIKDGIRRLEQTSDSRK